MKHIPIKLSFILVNQTSCTWSVSKLYIFKWHDYEYGDGNDSKTRKLFPNLSKLNKKPVKDFVHKAENLNTIIKNRSLQFVFILVTSISRSYFQLVLVYCS